MSAEIETTNPYVGPRPYERNEQDSSRFFGRTRETQEIVSLIFGHPLLLVYAQSGAGKTSLFNASITTTLENEGFEVLPLTRVRGVIPETVPLDQIPNLYTFNALLNMETEALPQTLATESLASFLTSRPRANDETGDPVPRVLIFDQFEELFTFTPHGFLEQQMAFFQQVTEALDADPLLRVVFLIREDFLAQLDPYARLLPERLRTRYRLERLQEDAALHAIKDPLSRTNRSFDPGVAESLVKELLFTRTVDAAGDMAEVAGQYVEPVQLQVVCLTLWSGLPPECTLITQEHLAGFDVNRALSNFYSKAIETTIKDTGVEEAALREWFGKTLITPMETRSTVYRGEQTTGGIPNKVVDALESRHLIRAEYRAGVRWYELTHDRFIEAILDDNEEWYSKRRETLGNPITAAARDWQRLGEDEGSLLRGASLEEANAWAQTHPREMDDLERSFLKASQARYQRELELNARTARTFRNLTAGLVVVALIAIGSASRAVQQSNAASSAANTSEAAASTASAAEVIANRNKINAETEAERAKDAEAEARSGQLAIQSITNLETDPQLSLLLAIEAINVQHTFESDDALRQALDASQARVVLSADVNRLNALAFSPNGALLATGGADGTGKLWDAVTGVQLGSLEGHEDSITALVFNPDEGWLATAGADGNVLLWDVNHAIGIGGISAPVEVLSGHEGTVIALAFSPDGHLLVTSGADGTARLWDMLKYTELAVFEGHTDIVNTVAISPDGNRIVTASLDGTAILWDTGIGKIVTLTGHTSGINAVAFSPDGRVLATASADGTARLWDAANGAVLAVLSGHSGGIVNIAYSPDGLYLATVSEDTTARLWDTETFTEMAVLSGHSDRITAVTFSPDGQLLATASADGTARLWSVPGGSLHSVFQGHTSSVNVVAFSPDGTVLATASSDGTARVWDVASEEAQRILRGQGGETFDVEFNPEGTLLAGFGEDSVVLWDVSTTLGTEVNESTPTLIEKFGASGGFFGFGFGVEFSPDGRFLALSSLDEENEIGTLSLLDASTLPDKKILDSQSFPEQFVFNMAFARDPGLLAISAINQDFGYTTVRLWDISADRTNDQTLQNMFVIGLAFSPDGTLLVTSGGNVDGDTGTIHLWDVSAIRTGDGNPEVAVIRGQVPFLRVAFTPEGQTLVSSTLDGTIRLWDIPTLLSSGADEAEVAVLRGDEREIWGLALSADGRLLATGDGGGSVRLWDVATALETGGTDAERSILRGHSGGVFGVTFSPDSRWLVTASEDETVRLWPVEPTELTSIACSQATRNLSQIEWDTYFSDSPEYRRTCEDLPYHPTVLETMIEQGRQYVREGQYDLAVAKWQEVINLDPGTNLNPDEMLIEALAEAVEEHLARGEYGRAVDGLRKLFSLSPDFSSEAVFASQEIVDAVADQESFTSSDQVEEARAALSYALELDPDVDPEALAQAYHVVCRLGSLDRFAQSALPACQRAVVLADENDIYSISGAIRDSRGIARALAGDLPGAIRDFTFFVEWAEDNFVPEETILKREEWIELLEEGKNPFDENPELLQEIRDE